MISSSNNSPSNCGCRVIENDARTHVNHTLSRACTLFTYNLQYQEIPKHAIDQIKICFFDWLGCVIKGLIQPQAQPAKDYLTVMGGGPQASIIGQQDKASIIDASFFHGYLGHILELDDVDRESISHPATVVFPAALAVAEHLNKTGQDLLTAAVAGYETMLRIGAAITPAHYEIWHTTGTAGTFGSAMSAGKLMNLKLEKLDWALGNAGTTTAGLWQFLQDGGMSKFIHAGRAASNGVFSAFMADKGLKGATHILEGSQGFFAGYARQEINPKIFQDFYSNWRSAAVSIKPYPCCRHTHSAIDAANYIREQLQGKEIACVHAKTYSPALQVAGIENPQTPQEAKFSLKFCIARALQHGLLTEKDFTTPTLHDTATRALMEKISITVEPEFDALVPQQWPSELLIKTPSDEVVQHRVLSPTGDPDNALDWKGIEFKFNMMTEDILSVQAQNEISDMCRKLEDLKNCNELIYFINQKIK